jgi:LuxR family maltose regulon positive regulatory protein
MSVTSHSRIHSIPRDRLLDALRQWPRLRLVRIVAPAGFGKTSLAAAWLQQLAQLPDDQRPLTAWCALFPHLTAERFVRCLVESLDTALLDLHPLLAPASSGELSPAQSIHALCRLLAAAPRPVVLVVDDVHLLSDPALLALLQQLLDHVSDRFSLVLLSRSTPPLRIAELILTDAVLTFNERDLALDHDEFTALARLTGLDAQPQPVLDDLERRCAGWVTGLKLLSYEILHPALPGRLFDPAADGAIRHFLESRVLTQLAAPLHDFALAAAHLPWISADLMAAVSAAPVDVSRQRIFALVAAIGFLSEFDAAGEQRFRFHPLFQDALRSIAESHGPQHAQRRRAAAWFIARDDVDAGLAILAPDIDLSAIADDVAAAVHRVLLRFDLVAARRWLVALPTDLLNAHASLALNAAWLAFLVESVPQLDAALPRAAAALRRCPTQPELLLDLAVLESYHFLLHERRDDALRRLAEAEALATPTDSLGGGYLHLVRFLLPRTPGDLDARTRDLQTAANIFKRIGFDYGVIQMMFAKTLLMHWFGDLPSALVDSDFLQGFARSHDRSRHLVVREDLRQRGEVLYLLNRIDEARAVMQSIVDSTHSHDGACGSLHLARIYLTLCDFADGSRCPTIELPHVELQADAEQWAQILGSDYAGNLGYIALPRILRDFRAGRFAGCWQTVESLRLSLDDISDDKHYMLCLVILSGAVLSGRSQPKIAELLDAFLARLVANDNVLMAQHARLLRVLHARQTGDDSLALERLQDLLPHVERSGALRLLLDFPDLQPLLARCDSPFAGAVLALFPTAQPAADFNLTSQEIRVLELLATGSTTKEIAAAQMLSRNTIYTHIQNVFRKLGVHSREEAVRVWKGREQL